MRSCCALRVGFDECSYTDWGGSSAYMFQVDCVIDLKRGRGLTDVVPLLRETYPDISYALLSC